MSEHTPRVIGAARLAADEASEVRTPCDGRQHGTVPAETTEHLDSAIAVAGATLAAGAIPTHERASILDRLADSLTAHHEEFAQSISAESAKPITTARGEAARAVDTARFAAAAARTMGGELITMDASSAGEGKTGFVKLHT